MAKEKRRISPAVIIGGLGLAGLLAFLFTRKAKAAPPPPPPPGYANLYGVVTDAATSKPISGVLATLDSLQAYTDANGAYAFTNITPGSYTATFSKAGYETAVF